MKVTAIQEDFGREIKCEEGDAISDLKLQELIEMIKTAGVLLFRNFNIDLERFNSFTDQFGTDYMTYKGGGYIRQQVNDGNDETLLSVKYDHGREQQDTFGLPLHGEMYYTENRPVMLWFYCLIPPTSDGETTVCDGSAIYNELCNETKQLLNQKRLKYIRKYLDGEWQKIYQTEDIDDAVAFAKSSGLDAHIDTATNALHTEFLHPAVITSRWGGHKVYINNMLTVMWQENMGRETSIVRFEDDTRIPESILNEVVEIQQRLIIPIEWRKGDFALIDNTRTLHGRRAFTDPNREVFLRMVKNVDF